MITNETNNTSLPNDPIDETFGSKPNVSELANTGAIEARRRGLGRGLSALLGGDEENEVKSPAPQAGNQKLGIELLSPSPFQPRRRFEANSLAALVTSVKEKGVMQPLLVRANPTKAGHYEIIAGERRWRAAQAAKLHEVPVIIKELSDRESLEVALIENIQRSDLTPVEEAHAYRRLMADFGHTQEELSGVIGKSRSQIANTLRLLNLPEAVLNLIEEGQISAGHGRALVVASDPLAIAKLIISQDLSVRATEQIVQREKNQDTTPAETGLAAVEPGSAQEEEGPSPANPTPFPKAPRTGERSPSQAITKDRDVIALEETMSRSLGLTVNLEVNGNGGSLTIHYQTLDQLDSLISKLGNFY
ncbi:MAG: ParB/RepB/Spo0J family partition protein [Alphaproteobacteria bacterium]|nr:ParB/RepB/Spo0J family partition protein [Alphaproteobacteria bacterium]